MSHFSAEERMLIVEAEVARLTKEMELLSKLVQRLCTEVRELETDRALSMRRL